MQDCWDIKEKIKSCWVEGGYCDGCEKWDEKCCDWPPCSWFCDIIVRGACLVCKWVPNIVCTLVEVVKGVVCVTIDAATAVAGGFVAVIEGALNCAWSVVGFVWGRAAHCRAMTRGLRGSARCGKCRGARFPISTSAGLGRSIQR